MTLRQIRIESSGVTVLAELNELVDGRRSLGGVAPERTGADLGRRDLLLDPRLR